MSRLNYVVGMQRNKPVHLGLNVIYLAKDTIITYPVIFFSCDNGIKQKSDQAALKGAF